MLAPYVCVCVFIYVYVYIYIYILTAMCVYERVLQIAFNITYSQVAASES